MNLKKRFKMKLYQRIIKEEFQEQTHKIKLINFIEY